VSHAIHDFTAKLRQPSVTESVRAYVRWRRALGQARAQGLPDPPAPAIAPISINLDLTTACNYRCDHCIDWDILNSRHKYAEEELRSSVRLMAERGLRSVILIGGGEPTLYPGFADFVKFLKTLRLQVAVVPTAAAASVHDAIGAWMRGLIRLSLDAGSVFIAMQEPVDRKLDLDAICEWIPRLKARNPAVRVGFSFIITWRGAERSGVDVHENIHEIVLATERAKRSGFDYISLKPFLLRSPEGAEVMDPTAVREELDAVIRRIRAEVDRAKAFADGTFDVFESTNLRVLEEGSWKDYTRQPRVCHMQALRQVLTPTGLYNCPAHRGEEKAKIASAASWRDEASAGETGTRLLQLMDRFDASHECREVTCLYNGVNWWLEKMIEDPRAELDSFATSGGIISCVVGPWSFFGIPPVLEGANCAQFKGANAGVMRRPRVVVRRLGRPSAGHGASRLAPRIHSVHPGFEGA
jgi:sulfatase maturation enzyme AslB (radical SAM superfamily)